MIYSSLSCPSDTRTAEIVFPKSQGSSCLLLWSFWEAVSPGMILFLNDYNCSVTLSPLPGAAGCQLTAAAPQGLLNWKKLQAVSESCSQRQTWAQFHRTYSQDLHGVSQEQECTWGKCSCSRCGNTQDSGEDKSPSADKQLGKFPGKTAACRQPQCLEIHSVCKKERVVAR